MNYFTRFRAYQLGNPGSSFSYAVDNNFTLIEARYNEVNKQNIWSEMGVMGCSTITTLHITSWDEDHCKPNELKGILKELKPVFIEKPGYEPTNETGKESAEIISRYNASRTYAQVTSFTPTFIAGLKNAEERKLTDIIYNPKKIWPEDNDNSTVRLYRRGRFSVLSLGDCMSVEIANLIASDKIACAETDVMIVAHHGADNGFTTAEFVKAINPRVAVCSSNNDNQYEHPRQEVRNVLSNAGVPLYTTKRGDVVIVCGDNNVMRVINLNANSTNIEKVEDYNPKMLIK